MKYAFQQVSPYWHKNSYVHFKRYIDYFNPKSIVFEHIADLPSIVSHQKIHQLKS